MYGKNSVVYIYYIYLRNRIDIFFWSIMGKPRNVQKKWPYAYLGSYLMRVEALTRNKPVFFQHVVEKKAYPYVGKIPYLAKTRNRQKKRKNAFWPKKMAIWFSRYL